MQPEALHIKLQLQLMRMVDATGDAVARVLERAIAQAVGVLNATAAPLSLTGSQLQLAQVTAIFRAAADESYRVFVERVEADTARWVGMSEREIAAELKAAQEQEREEATRKVLTAAVLLLPVIQRSQQAVRAASQMGALELTVSAQAQQYSLQQGMARAFVLPDGTPLQTAIKAPSVQAGVLFERRMRSAIINGQTSQDLARQLRDEATTPVRYVRNEARTGAQSVANAVNYDRLWEAPGLERVMFVATLDSRTTELCRSLNGRVYRLEDAPRPPLHRNCRSVLRAVWGGVVPTENLKTPLDWLRAQPAEVQDGVLGAAGGEAFRETGSLVEPARRRRR
jgi:SPP1 gp7 family putative phage head morphogenesis protein